LRVPTLIFGPTVLEAQKIKEKECLRDYMAEKGGGPFSWVVQAR
jgi:hypothetical protein